MIVYRGVVYILAGFVALNSEHSRYTSGVLGRIHTLCRVYKVRVDDIGCKDTARGEGFRGVGWVSAGALAFGFSLGVGIQMTTRLRSDQRRRNPSNKGRFLNR